MVWFVIWPMWKIRFEILYQKQMVSQILCIFVKQSVIRHHRREVSPELFLVGTSAWRNLRANLKVRGLKLICKELVHGCLWKMLLYVGYRKEEQRHITTGQRKKRSVFSVWSQIFFLSFFYSLSFSLLFTTKGDCVFVFHYITAHCAWQSSHICCYAVSVVWNHYILCLCDTAAIVDKKQFIN